ncbi:MAG: matrixin family metalloprotease [Acidobacteria bacterium]|nr:matrixin family metalloprotease [Acidobacteriota bacterium]
MRRLWIACCGWRIFRVAVILAVASTPLWAYVTTKVLDCPVASYDFGSNVCRATTAERQIVQERWKAFPVEWRMNPQRGSNVTGTREQADVIRQSAAVWQALTTASISLTEGSATDASVKPGLDRVNLITSNITAAEYRGGGALGITVVAFSLFREPNAVNDPLGRPLEFPGQILEADITFNPLEQFTTNAAAVADRIDLQSVATHEIGHFLGLDHTPLISGTMFPTIGSGFNYARALSTDDIAAISTIYPAASFATKGKLSGSVRTTANAPVYGAIVVAVNSSGQPVASAITNPSGTYTIEGLDAGAYTVYAEPMDLPFTVGNVPTLPAIYPGQTVNSTFATRYR